ncbi:MAG: ABC transporter ATP-binding protein [Firmicutes bacterium]|uniref:ABC transporter ATP-binding protein n=1 Tax=Candidatus Scatoplasma merdavium TaxID=2840932 RepID=A0A9D9D7G1_9BACL|nr:ABC transporter ATP-binding protein [Candidatus Scatoplasma merdavium]
MVSLDRSQDKLTLKTTYIVRRIFSYVSKHKKIFVFAMFLAVLNALFSTLGVFINMTLVELLQNSTTIDANKVYFYASIYGVCLLLQASCNFYSGYLIQKLGNDVIFEMRNDVYEHIFSLSLAQIQAFPTGKWVTRSTNDINSVMTFFANVLMVIFTNSLYIVFYTVAIFVMDYRLALVILAFMIIIFLTSFYFSKESKKKNRLYRKSISNMNSFLSENISGMETIQIFNQEKKKYEEFCYYSKEMRDADYASLKVFSIFRPIIYFLYVMTVLTSFIIGFFMIRDGKIDIILLYGFYQFIGYLFNPIQTIANQFNYIQQGLTGAERVFLVTDMVPSIVDSENPIELTSLKGKVEFKHVYFAYKGEEWILKDVSFVINPGQTVAFVGETGAGKSTIINLIVRNYDIQKGEILIDDIPIQNISIHSLRKLIGQMLQDVSMFSGDIKYNISLDDEKSDIENVKKSAEFVGADGFISHLKDGYDTVVSENGSNFSQGERQLISFARVIYAEPQMIILDEATSNIDTESEVIIQNSLEKIKTIGTMIMVAHRLSTIRHADTIYVIDKGQIAEFGSHQELLSKRGVYYNLYKVQSLDE